MPPYCARISLFSKYWPGRGVFYELAFARRRRRLACEAARGAAAAGRVPRPMRLAKMHLVLAYQHAISYILFLLSCPLRARCAARDRAIESFGETI